MLAMRINRRWTATSRANTSGLVDAGNHASKEIQRRFLHGQVVLLAGQQKAAKALVQEKMPLTAQRLLELERLLSRDVRGEYFDDLAQKVRSKRKCRAIVTIAHRVRHPVWLVSVEEQDVVRVGYELLSAPPPHEHAGADEHNLVILSALFPSTLATMRAAAHVGDGNPSSVIEPGDMEVRRHLMP